MTPAVVEGYVEEVLLPILLHQIGRGDLRILIRNAGGQPFWDIARRYNEAGRHQVLIGLADLEKAECPPTLIQQELGQKQQGFRLQIAVRMIESWLLADRLGFSDFFSVRFSAIPADPDSLDHPKRRIVDLARSSARRAIRDGMDPTDTGAMVGPEYTTLLAEYIRTAWNVQRARGMSPSLERACSRWQALGA